MDYIPLRITKEDAHATLGLPRGKLGINKHGKHKINNVMEVIANAMGKDTDKLTPTDAQEQL